VTDSITNAAGDQLPPNVQITFREDLDLDTQPEVRRVVERSVATHLARLEEAVAQLRVAEAERAKLEDALNAPLMKLIKEDPAATKALDDLRSGQLIDLDSTTELSGDQPLTATSDVVTARRGDFRLQLPPYDFQWSFSDKEDILPTAKVLTKQPATSVSTPDQGQCQTA